MNTSKDQIVDYTRKKQDQNNPLFNKKAREKCLLVSHFLLFVSVNHFSGDFSLVSSESLVTGLLTGL